MDNNSNIILIGYMGSGKTTLGKKLAKKLGFEFLDTDDFIEDSTNKSIPEIFNELGEDGFRKLEYDVLNALDVNNCVISVGGGMPCFYNNIDTLNSIGVTCYLKRPAKELMNRLINAKSKRPLIANKTEEELLSFISDQLNKREVFYNQAKLILSREEQEIQRLIANLETYIK